MWLARLTKSLRQPEKQPKHNPLLLNEVYTTVSERPILYLYHPIYTYILYKVWKRHTAERQWQNLFSPAPPLLSATHWILLIAPWLLTVDHYPLSVDHWLLTVDRWPLTVDCWPLERKWKKYVTEYLSVMKKVVLLHADYYHDEPEKGSDSLWKGVSSIGLERCLKRKQGDKL